MDGMLSQDEINALLAGANLDDGADAAANTTDETLTDEQKDAIGEVSNISMGTAATTLSTLLNQPVNITTPQVTYMTWDELADSYDRPCVFLQIQYNLLKYCFKLKLFYFKILFFEVQMNYQI